MADSQDFVRLIEPVARLLLGEPNEHLSTKGRELRFGSRGSMSVDLEKATWIDHETNEGGGFLDLVSLKTGTQGKDRFDWLEQHGFAIPRDEHHARGNGAAPSSPKLGKIVKTYDYTDEEGALLFQVVRFEPKDFRQRKPDKSDPSGWSWKIKGVRQVPYRLNEVIEAVANESVVYIVEGEKDADNLWDIGVPATTNAGGCGKWKRELSSFFRDADVVVIQDNDPQTVDKQTGQPLFHPDGRPKLPGQDHAQQAAADLFEVARRVRVLDLAKRWTDMPAKGDVTDWIKAGGDAEALFNLADLVPDWSPDMAQQEPEPPAPELLVMIDIRLWDGVEPPERKWIVRDRIPAKNVTLFTGEGGVGKTLLMQQLSVATCLGRDWIGSMVDEPGPVIFVTAEDDEDELHFRYSKIIAHYGVTFRDLGDLHIISLAGKDAVMAAVDGKGIVKPTPLFTKLVNSARAIRPKWIGIDTAADVFVVDERSRSEVRQCISLLRGLALDVNAAVVLLAHPSLAGISSGTGLSGSTAWNNSVRSRLYLKAPKKKEGADDDDEASEVRILETMKSNYAAIGEPVRLVWKAGLLLNEPGPTSVERINQDATAQAVFLALVQRYNKQDMTVSANPSARNFAPKVFAELPEAKAISDREHTRKRLLRDAMAYLLSKERVYVASGPKSIAASRQSPCLYAGGTLL